MTQTTSLLETITTHTENFNAFRNERLTEIAGNVINDLKVRTTDIQDLVVALYVANNDINKQIGQSIQGIRAEKDQLTVSGHINNVFEQQNANSHIENVLRSLNEKESFDSLYRKNQFYHGVNRFVQTEMVIPEGYRFLFGYQTDVNEVKHVLVNVDADTTIGYLFDTVFFGYFMPEPKTAEEREQLVFQVLSNSNVDMMSEAQSKDVSTKVKALQTFTSSEIIEKYYDSCLKKISVQ